MTKLKKELSMKRFDAWHSGKLLETKKKLDFFKDTSLELDAISKAQKKELDRLRQENENLQVELTTYKETAQKQSRKIMRLESSLEHAMSN